MPARSNATRTRPRSKTRRFSERDRSPATDSAIPMPIHSSCAAPEIFTKGTIAIVRCTPSSALNSNCANVTVALRQANATPRIRSRPTAAIEAANPSVANTSRRSRIITGLIGCTITRFDADRISHRFLSTIRGESVPSGKCLKTRYRTDEGTHPIPTAGTPQNRNNRFNLIINARLSSPVSRFGTSVSRCSL